MWQPPIKGRFLKKKLPPVRNVLGEIDSTKKTVADLTQDFSTLEEKLTEAVDTKLQELDTVIEEVKKIEPEKGETGEQGEPADEEKITTDILNKIPDLIDNEKIIEEVLSRMPQLDEIKLTQDILNQVPKLDENELTKKVLKAIPQNKASLKIIQEKFETDPMSVIEKIMELSKKGKFKLKTENIDGLEQTISAFRSQLGKGYLHGGGTTSPLTTKGDIWGYSTTNARIPIGTDGQVLKADSTQALGVKWATDTVGTGTVTDFIFTNGGGFTGTVLTSTSTPTLSLVLQNATTAQSGQLTSTDWNTFNNKANALSGTINEIAYFNTATTIASLTTATYPSLTELSYVKGVTSAIQTQLGNKQPLATNLTSLSGLTYVSLSFVKMSASGTFSLDTNTYLTGNQTITLSGDVSGSGATSITTTLATVNANVGTFGSATQSTQITANGKGLITAIANVTITPAVGSITGLGTGVATALAVNVGSAGAFVTFNGALGTPSSGTVTNLTGTASININGTVGATTPTTATFTTATANTAFVPDASGGADLGTSSLLFQNTFTNVIELGNASDTTLARVSAGVVSIEGKNIYVAGGTDVAVADGGTGKSSWTQYLIPYADTTTSFSQIAIGTSGQVLTSNGAGFAPTFQTVASGSQTPWTSNIDGASYTLGSVGGIGVGQTASAISVVSITGTRTGAAMGTTGGFFNSAAATYTDNTTAGGGTAANGGFITINRPTLDSTNESTVTYQFATFYIANSPADTAGNNRMVINNAYSLWVDAGNVRIDDKLVLGGNTLDTARTWTYNLSFNDDAAKTIGIERTTTAATAGRALTINAGGAVSGGTNIAGGTLTLQAGIPTGSGGSVINFQTATTGASGTTDRAVATKMSISGNAMTMTATSQFNAQVNIGSVNWATDTNLYVRAGATSPAIFYVLYDSTYKDALTEKEWFTANNNMFIGTSTAHSLLFYTNGAQKGYVTSAGSFVLGGGALATNATDGFTYIPTCAGTPTGAPTAQSGTKAMVYDTTNNKLYVYNGAWKGVTLA